MDLLAPLNPAERETLILSIKVALLSCAASLPFALATGWFLARHRFPGKALLDGLVNLPLVMPPVTTGYLLLLVLGRKGVLGHYLDSWFGITLPFTLAAPVIASAIVSFPLVVRAIRVAVEMVDPSLEEAAETLGAGPLRRFLTITVPLAIPGILGGAVLGFARSLGEFGATITFAGNIAGETRTLPLAVYTMMQIPGREGSAFRLVFISICVSFLALFAGNLLARNDRRDDAGGPSHA
jgi:molybdate transport system permease protein